MSNFQRGVLCLGIFVGSALSLLAQSEVGWKATQSQAAPNAIGSGTAGFAVGNNRALRAILDETDTPYLVTLNNDTEADPGWLAGLITRQVPIGQWADAYTRRPDDIKTVLTFPNGSP